MNLGCLKYGQRRLGLEGGLQGLHQLGLQGDIWKYFRESRVEVQGRLRAQNSKVIQSLFELDINASQACYLTAQCY